MASPSPSHARTLRPDIEGLRAIAVGVVLLYHLRVPGLSGGFAGVDVFFVISGFLITAALLREVERSGTVSLVNFYARRARRLLPAASVVILFTLVAGWFVLPVSQRPDLLSDVFGSTLYVVNWVLAGRSVDYLAEGAGVSPLQHYWSLSVEEQFYVLWPLLILLAVLVAARLGRRPRSTMLVLLSVLGAASLVWSVVHTASEPALAYFVTTTRLWELAAGAVLAFAVPRLQQAPAWLCQLAVAAGVVMIVVTVTVFDASTAWPGTAALVPVVGSVLVIAGGMPERPTAVGALLSVAPMVWIGGLSYAIYLWHWPLVVLAGVHWGDLGVPALVTLGVLSILLAWATKHLIEDPIRFRPSLAARPWASLVMGGTTMALLCGLAGAAWLTRPTLDEATTTPGPAALVADPDATPWELVEDPTSVYDATGPLEPDPALARDDIPHYYADGCQVAQGDPNPAPECVYGDPDSGTEVVVWGDSKLGQYFSGFEAIAQDEGWHLTTYLKSACGATVSGHHMEDCNEFGQTVVDTLVSQEVAPHVVVMNSGAGLDDELLAGMLSAATDLTEAGIPVLLLMDNSSPGAEIYECAAENIDDLRACDFPPREPQGEALMAALSQEADLPLLDLRPWICPEGAECPVAIGGQLIYRQGSHITDTYGRSLTPFLYRELAELGYTEATPEEIRVDDVPTRSGRG
ncbi:acyltransferase family protein [Ornithinimicrobium ciconiae]|uniref:acyltransferase family protein n=1 Tax=Ornithinimicrobium ciconiae TaxID=2594265 RepID=UPI0013FD0534|nr:acyltransferase family protein [Ornithinimicrobium ciconiae]